MNQFLEAALDYAARGWPVFPLKQGDKTPATPHGFKDATTDPDQIRAWWGRNPRYNIGIPTGADSGFVVIDTDNPDAEEYVIMQGDIDTRRATTPRGRHRLYQHPGYEVRNTTRLHGVDGLDVRGDGGYIVVAPSERADGCYTWENNSDLAPLPDWVTRKPEQARPSGNGSHTSEDRYAQTALNNELAALARCQNGTRNSTLFKVARRVNEFVQAGRLPESVFLEIETVALRTGLSEREVATTLQSARNGGTPEDAGMPVQYRRNDTAPEQAQVSGGPAPAIDVPDMWTGIRNNDTGNGQRFDLLYGDTCRYVARWQRWYIWTGTHWQFADEETRMQELARAVPEAMWGSLTVIPPGDPEDKNNPRLVASRWAAATGQMSRRAAMLQEARSRLYISHEQLDTHPDVLNVNNGTINLKTGELQPHRKEDLITHCIPIDYDADAACPRWLQFLQEIFSGDQEVIEFVRRGIGYTLTGQTKEHKLFFLYGGGKNGKSTLVNVVRALTGAYAAGLSADTLTMRKHDSGTPWEIAELPGKRLVVSTELETRRLREATIKDLTGGDVITAQRKREHPFQFRPQFKLWMYGNEKPRIVGTDDGIWRRILLVPFLESFEGREDDTLEETLMSELPGILAWAVQGAVQWYQAGLQAPGTVIEATREYREESDVLAQFVRDCCVVLPQDKVYPTNLLKEAYEEYTGVKISAQRFGQMLSSAGYDSAGRAWWGGKQQRCTRGIALVSDDDDSTPTDDDPIPAKNREHARSSRQTQESLSSVDIPHTNGQNDKSLDKLDRETTMNGQNIFSHVDDPESLSSLSSLSCNTNVSDETSEDQPTGEHDSIPVLPDGWRLVACDHQGNVTRFGSYWRAVHNDGTMTEPTQYRDSAARMARLTSARHE